MTHLRLELLEERCLLAGIAFDGLLNHTNQIRTASNNPYFGVGTDDLVGVNFYYEPGGISGGAVGAGASVNGVFFDNVNLQGTFPPSGPFAVAANGVAATMALNMPWSQTNEDNARTQNVGAVGPNAAILNTVAAEMFYLSTTAATPPFNHLEAGVTFSGLGADRGVYVQVIGGDTGPFIWNGDLAVTANGSPIGTWTSVADDNQNTGSLFAFETTTDNAGVLALNFRAVNGNHAAIAGMIISGRALTDIAVQSAELQAANQVQFSFSTTGDPGDFDVGLYRSTDDQFDPSDVQVGSLQTITPTGGQQTGSFTLPSPLPPDPTRPFLLVVADPNNAIVEDDQDPFNEDNTASIRRPDIVMLTATTADSQSITFTYEIRESDIAHPSRISRVSISQLSF